MNNKQEGHKTISIVAVVILSVITSFLAVVFVLKLIKLSNPSNISGENTVTVAISENDSEEASKDEKDIDNGLVSSKEVSEGLFPGQILMTDKDVLARAGQASWGGAATVSFEVSGGDEEDLIIIEFTAQSDSECPVPVEVLFNGDQKVTIEINDKRNRYYVPFYIKKGGRILSLRASADMGEDVRLSYADFCVVDYGKDCFLSSLKTGRYLTEEFITEKTEWEKDAMVATNAVSDGEFLYLIRFGDLIVYRQKQDAVKEGVLNDKNLSDSLKEVGRLKNLGQVFGVRFFPEKKLLLVCSRERGVYFINVKNPVKPVLYSHYETSAPCYGGNVYGDYAFLCNRYSGIEVVDVSDLKCPEYVTVIRSKNDSDYRNCEVYEGFLYAVAEEETGIDCYDVKNLGTIKYLGRTELDGQAQALEIAGNRLYVATSKNSTHKGSGVSGIISFMQGSGNGLEVYELSESGKIKLLSREKIDGRTNLYPSDTWDISIYGDYAYVSLMNAGLYIYDIKNTDAAKRAKAFHIVASKDSKGFVSLNPGEDIMPYPLSEESHSSIQHTAVLRGIAYVVSDSGVYRLPAMDDGKPEDSRIESVALQGLTKEKPIPSADGYEIDVFKTDGPAYDVVTLPDGNLAIACGEAGIRITDKEMNPLGLLDTGHSVKDLAVFEDYVYSAESDSMAIYYYEEGSLSEVGRVIDEAYNAELSSIAVSADGRLALVQAGYRRYRLINCTYRSHPFFKKNPDDTETGEMNGRNLCVGLIDEKVLGIGGTEAILWFEDGDSDDYVSYLEDKSELTMNEWTNMASLGSECILITEKGYTVYNPETGEISTEYESGDDYFNGECVVDENTLIIVKPRTGEVNIMDLSDIGNPVPVLHLDTDYTPDLPMCADNVIYIPLRYDGVMRIIRSAED